MPFLGQDWRSPGDQWVRTNDQGWERLRLWRLKLLENLNENVIARLLKLASAEYAYCILHKELEVKRSQPHVFVKGVTKEQNVHVSIAEAMTRLDFAGAVKDPKRFNYVCKLLEFIVQHKMSSLSGMAQKTVLNILEEAIGHVAKTHTNVHVVQQILDDLKLSLSNGHYNHVGSASLWACHLAAVNKLQVMLDNIKLAEREDDGKSMITDLPDELLGEILLRFADHRDLLNAGLAESRTFTMSQENRYWRQLCTFHFEPRLWRTVTRRGECFEDISWQTLYTRLMKRYGLRDVYAEMIHICRHCNALFWHLHGHPCTSSSTEEKSSPVSPTMFVNMYG